MLEVVSLDCLKLIFEYLEPANVQNCFEKMIDYKSCSSKTYFLKMSYFVKTPLQFNDAHFHDRFSVQLQPSDNCSLGVSC